MAQRPALPFVEVHSENFFGDGGAALQVLHQVREGVGVSLHGVGLALGSAVGLDPWHLDRLQRLVERIDPLRVSDHASFARGQHHHANDLLPIAFTPASLDLMVANVQRVQDRLKRPLGVENLSAYLRFDDVADAMPEPVFFAELARRSGCWLLLDVNNLVVNALNAGQDPVAAPCAWIDALGASASVGEIHLAGHTETPGLVIDDHGSPVKPPVWAVYAHAIAQFGPRPTLVEWDTDLPALDVLLHEAAEADRLCVR
ncbi:MAG: DUF692 domain-containing protein [Burkholderiaceae bacterium]|nr:DUF692 domain-containing protein [Rhodoferax sp.]MCP5283326.1 DUF692 domain-containing protein [Burkholderiaceae bacterium]